MSITASIIGIITSLCVFVFALQKFSRQIQYAAGDKIREILHSLTSTPLRGTIIGTLFTALLQSSTATTVITVGLVDAGLVSFTSSLGVIFGANIGSTVTTQLIALNLSAIAPIILIAGFILERIKIKWQKYGRALFYFGLVFFSLSIMVVFIEPLKTNTTLLSVFGSISSIGEALFIGFVVTAILQSSGVVSGLSVILVSQGLLTFDQAIGIILGANIGTTVTALIAAIPLHTNARRAAVAHLLFNVLGVLVMLPFLRPVIDFIQYIDGATAQEVANFHVLFNVVSAFLFLLFIKPFARLVELIVKEKKS